ncbi:radical SAM protein [Chloroflexota bacterium]
MKYVFGPVSSRRLGQSLGIDTIPLKTCNWNCIYCQLGRTRPLINERKDYTPTEIILEEVREAMERHDPSEIDWITFVGSGEPTLHKSVGWLIRSVMEITNLPVAVITNGSLLYLPEVRQELLLADAVLPSLDAGIDQLYRKINRPHPEITFKRLLQGLIDFRQEYLHKLWIEVMLMKGINDNEKTLVEIAAILEKIGPDEIHINLPSRPPVETWVKPADEKGLLRAKAVLGENAKVVQPAGGTFELDGIDDIVEAIIGIISRHPIKEKELTVTLANWSPNKVDEVLLGLLTSRRVKIVNRYGEHFWTAATANFPEKDNLKTH